MGNEHTMVIKRNQGFMQAFLQKVNEQVAAGNATLTDGKITKSELSAAMDTLDEINKERKKNGQSIFAGSTERNGLKSDWHSNYVVHPGQEITLSQAEVDSLYAALGVEIKNTENIDPEPEQPEEPKDTTIVPPVVIPEEPKDTTVVPGGPENQENPENAENAEGSGKDKKKINWLAIGLGVLAAGATVAAVVSHKNAKQAMDTAKQAMEKVGNLGQELGNVQNTVTGLGQDLSSVKTTVTNLGKDVTGLKDTVTGLTDKVDDIGKGLGDLTSKVDGIGSKVDDLENTVKNIDIKNIEQKVDDMLKNGKDELGNFINGGKDELTGVINGGKDELGNFINNGKDEITGVINGGKDEIRGVIADETKKATKKVGDAAGKAISKIREAGQNTTNPIDVKKQQEIEQAWNEYRQQVTQDQATIDRQVEQLYKDRENLENALKDWSTEKAWTQHETQEAKKFIEEQEKLAQEIKEFESEIVARKNSYVPENFFSNKSGQESAAVFEANASKIDEVETKLDIIANNKKNQEISSVLNSIEHNHTGATVEEIYQAAKETVYKSGLHYFTKGNHNYVIEVGKNGKVAGILEATVSKGTEQGAQYLSDKKIAKFLDNNADALKSLMAA